MNKIVKLALILFAVSAIVALCLGLVNGITAERIEAIAAEKLANAMDVVLPAATEKRNTAMQAVLPASEYPEVEYTGTDSQVDAIYKAGDAGYVVQCTVGGSQGTITMITGVDLNGAVTGISVLDHGETPGLGAIAGAAGEKGDAFRAQFAGLTSAAVTKDGGSVEALTGATVTSRAICAGVNAALACAASLG